MRTQTALLAAVLLAALAPVAVTAQGNPARPDMIVVMVDDMGAIDERVLSRLPNINALFLENGLRFDAAYSETPLCCPGRAAFLTGQHTRRHGVVKNKATLLDPTNTLATVLQANRYHTILAGKYLNNSAALADKSPVGWDRVALLDWTKYRAIWYLDDVETPAGYDDRFLVDTTLSLLREAPDGPIFAWLNSRAPHWGSSQSTPWLPSVEPQYVGDERCTGIEPWKPPSYAWPKQPDGFPLDEICRSLLTVDDLVGAVRSEMNDLGRSPVWMLTADNGMAWGAHGFPLKNVPQAGRLPLYFAGPGVGTGSTSALVSNIDLGPTLAELANTTMPFADGASFAHLLDGEGQGREWMLEDHPVGGYTGGPWRGEWYGVRTPEWHMWKRPGSRPRLYHLPSDPWELRNVRKKHKAVVQKLKALAAPLLTQ